MSQTVNTVVIKTDLRTYADIERPQEHLSEEDVKKSARIEQPQEQFSEEFIPGQGTEETLIDNNTDNNEELGRTNEYRRSPKRSPYRTMKWYLIYIFVWILTMFVMVLIVGVIYSHVALAWADETAEVPPIDKGLAASYRNDTSNATKGEILIVGAGASGLFAGYTLAFLGIPFTILEASEQWGGRVQRTDDFGDVPLDLGAEWIHTNPRILQDLLLVERDQEKAAKIEVAEFQPQSFSFVSLGRRVRRDWGRFFYKEYKFESSTWSQWLEEFVVPHVQDNIVYSAAVWAVDYSSSSGPVTVTTRDGSTFTGDKAILAVPMNILHPEEGDILFSPRLPSDKRKALRELVWAPGGKMFIEFEEAFYTDFTTTVTLPDFLAQSEMSLFFDALFGKPQSTRHIMGILQVGEHARSWDTASDNELLEEMMAQLDALYDGQATKNYVKHQVLNWSQNPFVRGTYLLDGDTDSIEKAVGDKVFFAVDSDSTVQSAALSGRRAAVEAVSS